MAARDVFSGGVQPPSPKRPAAASSSPSTGRHSSSLVPGSAADRQVGVGRCSGRRSSCRPEHRHLHRASCGGISRGSCSSSAPTRRLPGTNSHSWMNRTGCPVLARFTTAAHCPTGRASVPEQDHPHPQQAIHEQQHPSRALEAVFGDLLSSRAATAVSRLSGCGGQGERKDRGNAGVSQELRRHRHRPTRVHAVVDQQDRAVHREQSLGQMSVDRQLLPHLCQA